MSDNEDRETVRAALRSWGNRRRILDAERNRLVLRSLKAGITIEEIHQSTGLGRSTIDRIQSAAKGGWGA